MKDVKLDETDKKIIYLLRKNSRITISDIARNIDNLTESTIRYRLDKLERDGYIKQYTILLDSKRFGKNFMVIFNLKVLPEHIQEAIGYLKKLDCLTVVYLTMGTYSVVAIGFFKNNKEITGFITEKLKNVPLIDYDVAQVLRKEKEIFYWS